MGKEKTMPPEGQSHNEQEAKKEIIFINGRPFPWNITRETFSGVKKNLTLRLYIQIIGIYFTDWVRKRFRSFRNSPHGLIRFGRYWKHNFSNNCNNTNQKYPTDNC